MSEKARMEHDWTPWTYSGMGESWRRCRVCGYRDCDDDLEPASNCCGGEEAEQAFDELVALGQEMSESGLWEGVVEVCKMCDRKAQWPFCEHKRGDGLWYRVVRVREVRDE